MLTGDVFDAPEGYDWLMCDKQPETIQCPNSTYPECNEIYLTLSFQIIVHQKVYIKIVSDIFILLDVLFPLFLFQIWH